MISEIKVAHRIKELPPKSTMVTSQEVFELVPPFEDHRYVLVTAANVFGTGPETYVFAADQDGEVLDWAELEGSYRGGLNIDKALENMGYEVRR